MDDLLILLFCTVLLLCKCPLKAGCSLVRPRIFVSWGCIKTIQFNLFFLNLRYPNSKLMTVNSFEINSLLVSGPLSKLYRKVMIILPVCGCDRQDKMEKCLKTWILFFIPCNISVLCPRFGAVLSLGCSKVGNWWSADIVSTIEDLSLGAYYSGGELYTYWYSAPE